MDPTDIYKELPSRQASGYCLRQQIILNAIVILWYNLSYVISRSW
jgi:hypothetical protein